MPKKIKQTDEEKKPAPWKRAAPVVGQEAELSADEIAAAVGDITAEDIRKRSEALNEAQERWEDLAFISTEKIPCRECGGRGNISAGTFGDIDCPSCNGQRVVEHPGNEKYDMPDFAGIRAGITAYGNALADRLLPNGHPNKRGLALPAPETVPTLESLHAMVDDVKAKAKEHKQLAAASNTQKLLDAQPQRRRRRADEEEGGFEEADFQEMEADAEEP